MVQSSAKVSVQKQKKIGVTKKKKTTAAAGGAGMVEEDRARYLVLEDRFREFRALLLRLQHSLDRVEHRLSAIEDCFEHIRNTQS